MRDIVAVCLPKIPENTAKIKEQAYNYFAEKIERIRNYAVDNIKCAEELHNENAVCNNINVNHVAG